MTKSNLLLGIVIFALLAGGWLNTAPAQVFDEAKFFSRDVALQADKQLRQLGKIHGLTLVIETFMQPPADVAELIRNNDKRAAAFARWAEQRRATQHAHLYILLCRKPGHVEIALHESLAARFSREDLNDLRDLWVRHLRQKQPDVALRESIAWIEKTLAAHRGRQAPAVAAGKPGGVQAGDGGAASETDAGGGDHRWILWAILIGVGVVILFAIVRGLVHALSGPTGSEAPPVAGTGPGPGYGGYGGSAGGSFLGSFLAGALGAAVGSWVYDRFFRGGQTAHAEPLPPAGSGPMSGLQPPDDPTARYAPESGRVITTGGDFDTESPPVAGTGADVEGLDEADEDWDAGDVEAGGFGDDSGSGFSGGDFDAGGDFGAGDWGGGDFGGDIGGDF